MDSNEETAYKELSLFYAIVYIKFWFLAPIATDAPKNDLDLYKILVQYHKINSKLSNAALTKLRNHLWYVGPELVILSLFSEKVKQTIFSGKYYYWQIFNLYDKGHDPRKTKNADRTFEIQRK